MAKIASQSLTGVIALECPELKQGSEKITLLMFLT